MSEPTQSSLTKEERAFFMRHLWEALLAPQWTKDDLIDLGKSVYAKTPLKSLDEKLFTRLFPHLLAITDELGSAIKIDWQTKIFQQYMDMEEVTKAVVPILVAPVAPTAPPVPASPVAPTAPAAPASPVAPTAPIAPVAPVAPVTPVVPIAPPTSHLASVAPTPPPTPTTPAASAAPKLAAVD